MPPLLRLRDLCLRHSPSVSLRFPDLELPAGGRLRIHGDSGSGKSTLIALIAGLLTPSAGEVEFDGQPLSQLSARERDAWRGAQLGVVPQRLHLSSSLSVRHNLELPFICAGEPVPHQHLTQVVSQLGIEGLLNRRPHQISVGQAQRVAIARAVMRRPRLIVADEPTASLDDRAAAEALHLLSQAAAQHGAALVVATHDRRVAEAFPDAPVLHLVDAA